MLRECGKRQGWAVYVAVDRVWELRVATLRYFAPGSFANDGAVSMEADVHALGGLSL